VINNPKTARIVAIVVIAMLVITLAASLFGCAADKSAAANDTDPTSGLKIVAVADLPKEAQDTLTLIDQGGPYPYSRDGNGGQRYYTDNHYESFRRIAEDGGTS
jgi:ribonuclease T1